MQRARVWLAVFGAAMVLAAAVGYYVIYSQHAQSLAVYDLLIAGRVREAAAVVGSQQARQVFQDAIASKGAVARAGVAAVLAASVGAALLGASLVTRRGKET